MSAEMIEIDTDRMCTRAEVAEMIGVTPKTLREWERSGRGPAVVRFSPKVARYPASGLARFLKTPLAAGSAKCA